MIPESQAALPDSQVDPMLPRTYRVTDSQQDTADTVTLSLMPTTGPPLSPVRCGTPSATSAT